MPRVAAFTPLKRRPAFYRPTGRHSPAPRILSATTPCDSLPIPCPAQVSIDCAPGCNALEPMIRETTDEGNFESGRVNASRQLTLSVVGNEVHPVLVCMAAGHRQRSKHSLLAGGHQNGRPTAAETAREEDWASSRISGSDSRRTVAKVWQNGGCVRKPLILLERAKGFEPSTLTLAT